MDYYDMDDSMVPERDASNAGYQAGDELVGGQDIDTQGGVMQLKTSISAFNQQRTVVAKLSRGELEDRYLRLLEENVVLKKHAVKQEDKIKKLATKLIRVMSDKKRLEIGGGNASNIRGHRDLETEELIEDQQQRIRELERVNTQFKDKLMVAKNQIMSVSQQSSNTRGPRRSGSTVPPAGARYSAMGGGGMHSPQQTPSLLMPSPTPTSAQQLLSQQAQNLLEEARNENRMLEESVSMLKEQVNMLALEVEQTHEQAKIKEANYEEEQSFLKNQLRERNYQDVAENIELIRLQQDKKSKATVLTTMKAQIQALEEEVVKYKTDIDKLRAENSDLSTNLSEEQRKAINLAGELSNNSSSRQALTEADEKLRDLQKENAILRESNAKLLDSAYNVERERQFVATENALKVQVAQLEATLKADLSDKKVLSEALETERRNLATTEVEMQDLQSKYFTLKEDMEGHEEKLKFFARENSIDASELEQALLHLRQQSSNNQNWKGGKLQNQQNSYPDFLETADENGEPNPTGENNIVRNLRSELSQIQTHHVEAVNELEKTRSLLRVQATINQEQKMEAETLQQRLFQIKAEFQSQIGEYKKLLDMRAARIHKLEMQVRETTYGQVSKLSALQQQKTDAKSHTVHTPSGQSLFEIHIQKANLTKECLLQLGTNEPLIFATWTFYEHDMQYTPVIKGPQALLDCSAYYKVKLDDAFLDFLMDSSVMVEIHMTSNTGGDATDEQCKTVGKAELKLAEVVHYPSNKLHGSVLINSSPISGSHRDPSVVGSLDFWFKLHTAAASRIQEWLDHRQEVQRALEIANKENEARTTLAEVQLLKGEQRAIHLPEHQEKLVGRRRKLPIPEPVEAPRLVNKVEETKEIDEYEPDELKPESKQEPEETKTEAEVETKPEVEPEKEPVIREVKTTKVPQKRLIKTKGSTVEIDEDSDESVALEKVEKETVVKSHTKLPKVKKSLSSNKAIEATSELPENSVSKKAEKSKEKAGVKKAKKKEVVESEPEKTEAEANIQIEAKPVPKPRGPIQGTEKDKVVIVDEKEKQAKSEWDSEDDSSKDSIKSIKTTPAAAAIVKEKEEDVETVVLKPTQQPTSKPKPEISESEESEEESEEEEVSEEVSEEGLEEEDDEEEDSEESEDSETGEEEDSEEGDDNKPEKDLDDKKILESPPSVHTTKVQIVGATSDENQTTTGESSSTSHDSEGVVVRKESIGGSHSSINGNESITITVSEFKAGKNANFLKNKKIQKLFVEYSFLDLKSEETETPFALPKPKSAGETIVFNFSKVIPMDKQGQPARRKLLSKLLKEDQEKESGTMSKKITFSLVSEPEEETAGECEIVGTTTVDLEALYKSERDLVDAVLDIYSVEPQTRVSKFLGSKKIIGTLTVSVLASDVFKSLKI